MAAQNDSKTSLPPYVYIIRTLIWALVVLVVVYFIFNFNNSRPGRNQQTYVQDVTIMRIMEFKFGLLAATTQASNGPQAASGAEAVESVNKLAQQFEGAKLQGSRILWVDDHPDNNVYERQSLSALGIGFDKATSTDEALKLLDKNHYDLVISDFKRADDPQGGQTLTEDLQRRKGSPPIIIYSGGWTPEFEDAMKKHGAYGETNQVLTLFQMVVNVLQNRKSASS